MARLHPLAPLTDPRAPRAPRAHARTIDDLDADIRRIARGINAQCYRFLVLVREFDERLGFAKWGMKTCAEWLAWRCDLSVSAAREQIRTAHALRRLPAISAAFARGRLSYSKVRALTRVADLEAEERLLAYALEASAAQVEERCRQMRNVRAESVEVSRRAWERRSMSVYRNASRGTLTISVEVPIEEGELIARAVDRAVEAGEVEHGVELEASGWQAQQADALVAVAKAYLAGGVDRREEGSDGDRADAIVAADAGDGAGDGAEGRCAAADRVRARAARSTCTADHYQVVVHVDAAALRGGVIDEAGGALRGGMDEPLRGGPACAELPIETIRRLTCDGSLITLLEDEDGTPLDVGRKQRTVPTALRRALWARDRGCGFPGCRHTHYVDAHHILHWALGGETSLENLVLLCSHHHRLVHEGAFRIRRDGDGEIYFQRMDGRVIPRGGYRVDDIVDDDIGDGDPYSLFRAAIRSRKPSAEVRERGSVYSLGSR